MLFLALLMILCVGDCISGGVLRNVFLEGGFNTYNHSLIPVAYNMKQCISECCKLENCDLAMFMEGKCYQIDCALTKSCRITHGKVGAKNIADIAFIIKREGMNYQILPSIFELFHTIFWISYYIRYLKGVRNHNLAFEQVGLMTWGVFSILGLWNLPQENYFQCNIRESG